MKASDELAQRIIRLMHRAMWIEQSGDRSDAAMERFSQLRTEIEEGTVEVERLRKLEAEVEVAEAELIWFVHDGGLVH